MIIEKLLGKLTMSSKSTVLDKLLSPEIYPHPTRDTITLIETNVSLVLLTGDFAYKMKKPVKFGEVLDFSTLEKRLEACKNEILFNKRLAPTLYLGVEYFSENGEIGGKGRPIEYLVKMRQLPQETLLVNIINETGKLDEKLILDLAKKIASFHKKNIYHPEFSVFDAIYEKWDENFRTTHTYDGFPEDMSFEKRVYDFLSNNEQFWLNRGKNGRIVEGHGDLILRNIFYHKGELIIFDCIEFNKMLRIQDVLEEVSFLAMDLDYYGLSSLSDLFIKQYLAAVNESITYVDPIIQFYKTYRAFVRAKVFFSQSLHETEDAKREKQKELSLKYYELSKQYRF